MTIDEALSELGLLDGADGRTAKRYRAVLQAAADRARAEVLAHLRGAWAVEGPKAVGRVLRCEETPGADALARIEREAVDRAMRDVRDKAIALAARLVRLSDRTPNRGDPAYDDRPEVVDREAVVDVAMDLKRLGEAAALREAPRGQNGGET